MLSPISPYCPVANGLQLYLSILSVPTQACHGVTLTIKFIIQITEAQQAKLINSFKNDRYKLLKNLRNHLVKEDL
jgi:hypothetical protein